METEEAIEALAEVALIGLRKFTFQVLADLAEEAGQVE
jgi:hypothetical protein